MKIEDKFYVNCLTKVCFHFVAERNKCCGLTAGPSGRTLGPKDPTCKEKKKKEKKFKANLVFHRKCQCWQFLKEGFIAVSTQNTAPQSKFLSFCCNMSGA